jgi:hypothetical protein
VWWPSPLFIWTFQFVPNSQHARDVLAALKAQRLGPWRRQAAAQHDGAPAGLDLDRVGPGEVAVVEENGNATLQFAITAFRPWPSDRRSRAATGTHSNLVEGRSMLGIHFQFIHNRANAVRVPREFLGELLKVERSDMATQHERRALRIAGDVVEREVGAI